MKDKLSVALIKTLAEICKTPEDLLKYLSKHIWNRIEFARKINGLKIYETSITQELLYQITIASQIDNFNIQLYEANSEIKNGNDIECIVKLGDKYIILPMQAKILHKSGYYGAFNHTVNEQQQVHWLIQYAKEKEGLPLYLLYSYSDKIKYANEYNYGISFANVFALKEKFYKTDDNKWKSISFEKLHSNSIHPFHALITDISKLVNEKFRLIKENGKIVAYFSKEYGYNLKLYTRDELKEDEYWIEVDENLIAKTAIGQIVSENKYNDLVNEEVKMSNRKSPSEDKQKKTNNKRKQKVGFSPQYRMIME